MAIRDGGGEPLQRQKAVSNREVQKTTMVFDKELYRALKFHSFMTSRPVREIVEDYVRSGLSGDGVNVNSIPGGEGTR